MSETPNMNLPDMADEVVLELRDQINAARGERPIDAAWLSALADELLLGLTGMGLVSSGGNPHDPEQLRDAGDAVYEEYLAVFRATRGIAPDTLGASACLGAFWAADATGQLRAKELARWQAEMAQQQAEFPGEAEG